MDDLCNPASELLLPRRPRFQVTRSAPVLAKGVPLSDPQFRRVELEVSDNVELPPIITKLPGDASLYVLEEIIPAPRILPATDEPDRVPVNTIPNARYSDQRSSRPQFPISEPRGGSGLAWTPVVGDEWGRRQEERRVDRYHQQPPPTNRNVQDTRARRSPPPRHDNRSLPQASLLHQASSNGRPFNGGPSRTLGTNQGLSHLARSNDGPQEAAYRSRSLPRGMGPSPQYQLRRPEENSRAPMTSYNRDAGTYQYDKQRPDLKRFISSGPTNERFEKRPRSAPRDQLFHEIDPARFERPIRGPVPPYVLPSRPTRSPPRRAPHY